MDTLYTFITTYPASLPIFFLIVTAGLLVALVAHDHFKAE